MPAAAFSASNKTIVSIPRPKVLADLRRRLALLERGQRSARSTIGFGVSEIDCHLPEGGLTLGAVHEFLGEAASVLAAIVAGRLSGPVLWCLGAAERGEPHGPGLAALGLNPSRLFLARCRNAKEMLWTMEEGLRSAAPAVVIAEPETDIGLIESRRLQLAAEAGNTLGLVLREGGDAGRRAPSAVASRWRIDPAPGGGWRLILRRCRGAVDAENEWRTRCDDASADFALAVEAEDGPGAAARRFRPA